MLIKIKFLLSIHRFIINYIDPFILNQIVPFLHRFGVPFFIIQLVFALIQINDSYSNLTSISLYHFHRIMFLCIKVLLGILGIDIFIKSVVFNSKPLTFLFFFLFGLVFCFLEFALNMP